MNDTERLAALREQLEMEAKIADGVSTSHGAGLRLHQIALRAAQCLTMLETLDDLQCSRGDAPSQAWAAIAAVLALEPTDA